MYRWKHLIGVVVIGFLWTLAYAAPPRVERLLPRHEPVYQQTPYYCLLVIGPEAKAHWLVLDGDTVYFDRKGNGDLTAKENRIPMARTWPIDTAGKATVVLDPKAPRPKSAMPPGNLPRLCSLGAIRMAGGQVLFSNLIFDRLQTENSKEI